LFTKEQPANITLSKGIRIIGANAKFVYQAPDTSTGYWIFSLIADGQSVHIEGLRIEGNDELQYGFRVMSFPSSMDDPLGTLTVRDVQARNLFSNRAGSGATGFWIQGGWEVVCVEQVAVESVGRSTPTDFCTGITVTSGAGAYARHTSIKDIAISTIYSAEAEEKDKDGIAVLVPLAPAGSPATLATLDVQGARFVDCAGRAIKSQVPTTTVRGVEIVRTGKVPAFTNSVDIDLQVCAVG